MQERNEVCDANKWDESSLIQRTPRVSADAQSLTLALMNGIMALACCWRSERIKYEALLPRARLGCPWSGALAHCRLRSWVDQSLARCLLFSVTPAAPSERESRWFFMPSQPSAAAGSHSTRRTRWFLKFHATGLFFIRELWSRRWWISLIQRHAFDFLRWFN